MMQHIARPLSRGWDTWTFRSGDGSFAPFQGRNLRRAVCVRKLCRQAHEMVGGWLEADFYISPTHMHCNRIIDGKIIATIGRMGVMIGVVKDHRGSKQAGL